LLELWQDKGYQQLGHSDNIFYDEQDRRIGLLKIKKLAQLIFRMLENLFTRSRSQPCGIEFSPIPFNLSKVLEVNVNLHKLNTRENGVQVRD
jgi:hypothetical protein